MRNTYVLKFLFVMAVGIAGYIAEKTQVKDMVLNALNISAAMPGTKVAETPVSTTEAKTADDALVEADAKAVAKAKEEKTVENDEYDPSADLGDLMDGSIHGTARYIEVQGIKIDVAEIDLAVETEIAAGKLKSKADILSFRNQVISKKASEKLAQDGASL